MPFKTITSLQHPIVKYFVELRKERSLRVEKKEVLIIGEKVIREIGEKKPLSILMTLEPNSDIDAAEKYVVSPEILKKVTGVIEPDGFAALMKLPEEAELENQQRILILDQLKDPGNLGTLFRTALALAWEGVWLTPGTVDPFNDKALRAARGATFWLPLAWKSKEEICAWVKRKKATLYKADIRGEPIGLSPPKTPLALILSSESQGADEWPASSITIPMAKHVESLNVASSGAILLFALRPPS